MIESTFNKVSRLFAFSFEMECLLSKYHKSTVEIKDCNVLIDGKSFFDAPVRNKEEPCEDIIEMLKDNDYTRGNLLDYDECFPKHYRLIAIDLCKQIKLENSDITQYINFTGRFDRDERATMFSSLRKLKKQLSIFYGTLYYIKWRLKKS